MEFVKFLMEHREGNSTLTRKGYKDFPEKSHLMKWDTIKVHVLWSLSKLPVNQVHPQLFQTDHKDSACHCRETKST